MASRWGQGLLVLIVGALVAWGAKDQDWKAIGRVLLGTPLSQLIYLSLVFVGSRLLQTARFYTLCSGGLSFARHVGLNMGSQAGLILLPFRAGELFRPVLMKKWNRALRWRQLLFWIFVEKLVEAVTLSPLLIITFIYFGSLISIGTPQLLGAVGGVFLLGAAGLWWLQRRTGTTLFEWLRRTTGQSHLGRFLALPTLVSSLSWLSWWWLFCVVLPSPLLALEVAVGVIIASSIPALPAGLGAFEAAFVWMATRQGVPATQALASALLLHGVMIVLTLFWGVPFLVLWGIPSRKQTESLSAGTD